MNKYNGEMCYFYFINIWKPIFFSCYKLILSQNMSATFYRFVLVCLTFIFVNKTIWLHVRHTIYPNTTIRFHRSPSGERVSKICFVVLNEQQVYTHSLVLFFVVVTICTVYFHGFRRSHKQWVLVYKYNSGTMEKTN